jgi:hypothetical protein
VAEQNYWVRTEHGRVWGPYTLEKLERLRGQLTENCEASLDGQTWRPGMEFTELRDLLAPARKIEKIAPEAPSGPRITKAIAEAFGLKETPSEKPPDPPPRTARAAAPKPASPPPRMEMPQELPESGELAQTSPVRLYGLAVLGNVSGRMQFETEKGHLLQISFRRGTPEHLSSDDPDLSLVRFLLSSNLLPPEKALEAEEQASKSGQDIVSVLFQMQLIPTADAHKLLGDHAMFLLDRALISWRGKFTFEKDAPSPPGAFPLGSKWTLLSESVRRLDVPLLRARLGRRLLRPVVRSGGLGIGKVEELALNAQETRLFTAIDGTRSGEDLLKSQDAGMTIRLLYLLTELGHLGFAEVLEETTDPELEPVKVEPPPVDEGPQLPRNAERAPAGPSPRALPKTAREMGRQVPPGPKRGAAPPVMKSAPPVLRADPSHAPAAAKAMPPPPHVSRPPPTFAQGPEGEPPQSAMKRLGALFEKLQKADHFEALGMERKSASSAEAKRNFFVLAKELHPDTVTDPALGELRQLKESIFARINEAAQVLVDDKRRKEYEEELEGKKSSVDVARIFAAEEDFQRATILIKARKYKEGLELIDKAIALNAEEAEFHAWRGYARFLLSPDRKAAFEETAADCKKAIKMQELCLPAHLFLGHMAKVVGDMKLAKKCYLRVVELDDNHVEAQRELRLMGQKG